MSNSSREPVVLEPSLHEDGRGYFMEAFNLARFRSDIEPTVEFVQDNQSGSRKGTIRGLHYQLPPRAQGKLVRVIRGEVFDVAVDVRRSSSNFGRWTAVTLSSENRRQFWVPEGFAHGFLVLSDWAELLYKTTDYYSPQHDRCLRWNDPDLNIDWPMADQPVLSDKDREAPLLPDAELFG